MTGSVKLSTISKQFYMSAGQIRQKTGKQKAAEEASATARTINGPLGLLMFVVTAAVLADSADFV